MAIRHQSHAPPLVAPAAAVGAVAAFSPSAQSAGGLPLSYLEARGEQAQSIVPHLWGILGISIAVVAVIAALVLVGILRSRSLRANGRGRFPVLRTLSGTSWIVVGTAISAVILLGSMAWSAVVLTEISAPSTEPKITITVRGHQWWWEVTYEAKDPERRFVTANEIHIPVGEPVRFELVTADVIHSFWVPVLGGKTDLIPGRTTRTWLRADAPGVYRGKCQEYCGLQHAHMGFVVVAEEREKFDAWWKAQLQPAAQPDTPLIEQGQKFFVAKCGTCHTVRGTLAMGKVGPDLTHLMSRRRLAAATLPNTIGHLSSWVANPQRIKPGAHMPNLNLSGPELDVIRAYLRTLK